MISFTHAEIEKIVKQARRDTQQASRDSLSNDNEAVKAFREIVDKSLETMEKLILLDIASDVTEAFRIAHGK